MRRIPGRPTRTWRAAIAAVALLTLLPASGRGADAGSPLLDVVVVLREPSGSASATLAARRRAIRRDRQAVLAAHGAPSLQVRRRFATVSAFTATLTTTDLERLRADPLVVRADPVRYGSAALSDSVPLIRADAAHNRDFIGDGATVAVLDAGIDASLPDFAGVVTAEECFCGGRCCPNGTARQSGPGSAFSRTDHGNHVCGIIASQGHTAPPGVAPGAGLVVVKVLNDRNRGSLDDWIAGLDWIAANRPDVRVVNMSLVSDAVFTGPCDSADATTLAFAQVIGVLRARGTLTVAASGNSGHSAGLAAPACVTAALAVGATTKDDVVWPFSNSDTTLDVLAPGVAITSVSGSGGTTVLSGTSMAAPHVSGTAALLFGLDPAAGPDAVEAALTRTGRRLVDGRNGRSFPRINALGAVNAVLEASRPVAGGGSRERDCLVEWDVPAGATTRSWPLAQVTCRDGDTGCDADAVTGQCTVPLAACFNVVDRRLPRCSVTAPIVRYTLGGAGGAAAALTVALPPLPAGGADRCSDPVPIVVPAGATVRLRFTAAAADGRVDYDRLTISCAR